MGRNEATRRSCNYDAPKCSPGTRSIVSNRELFCLTAWTLAFTFALLAVPTVMALVRGWM